MTRAEDLRAIEQEIGVLIRRVKRVIGDRARAVHPDLGPVSLFVLTYLIERGPVRAADIAAQFGMDKGGVSRQVQQLVDLGLVERTPDPEDRRATLLVVSDEGARRTKAMEAERSRRFDQRLGDWSDAELAGFADQLRRYNAALEDRAGG